MKNYTIYRVIKISEGKRIERNDYKLTDDIASMKKMFDRINDSTQYDEHYEVEEVDTIELSDRSLKAVEEAFQIVRLHEIIKKERERQC